MLFYLLIPQPLFLKQTKQRLSVMNTSMANWSGRHHHPKVVFQLNFLITMRSREMNVCVTCSNHTEKYSNNSIIIELSVCRIMFRLMTWPLSETLYSLIADNDGSYSEQTEFFLSWSNPRQNLLSIFQVHFQLGEKITRRIKFDN